MFVQEQMEVTEPVTGHVPMKVLSLMYRAKTSASCSLNDLEISTGIEAGSVRFRRPAFVITFRLTALYCGPWTGTSYASGEYLQVVETTWWSAKKRRTERPQRRVVVATNLRN